MHHLERHEAGTCRVIPIILRPTYWQGSPFSKLQMLPTDAKPITRWADRDEAFHDVVKEISFVLKDLLVSLKTKQDWLDEGVSSRNRKRYDHALEAFEQTLHLDPKYLEAYQEKGMTLLELQRYDYALEAFELALHLNPNLAALYITKGQTLDVLERYEDALTAYEQALRLDPNLASAYIGRDKAFQQLGISRDAQKQLTSQLEHVRQQRDEALEQLGIAKKAQEELGSQLQQTQQQLIDQQKRVEQLESQLAQIQRLEKVTLLRSLTDQTEVWSVAISHDGQTLVNGRADHTIKVWGT
jgi:tetratricopeptide (TPR) repeat protein